MYKKEARLLYLVLLHDDVGIDGYDRGDGEEQQEQ
jgi:hypothetical protein